MYIYYTHLHQEMEHTQKFNTNSYARNPVKTKKIINKKKIKTQKIIPKLKEEQKSGGTYYGKIKGVDIPSSIDRVISLEFMYPFQSSSQFNVTRLGDDIYITEVESITG